MTRRQIDADWPHSPSLSGFGTLAAPIPGAQEASYISLAIGGESAAEGQSETLREIRYLAVLEMLVASLSMQIPELNEGQARYRDAKKPVIAADCGGSNGARVRLWKDELQKLADETGLTL